MNDLLNSSCTQKQIEPPLEDVHYLPSDPLAMAATFACQLGVPSYSNRYAELLRALSFLRR